jgi:hypothetical protein
MPLGTRQQNPTGFYVRTFSKATITKYRIQQRQIQLKSEFWSKLAIFRLKKRPQFYDCRRF